MSEWWTYSLSDFLMYSADTFVRLRATYDAWLGPARYAAPFAGAALAWVAWRGNLHHLRAALVLLAIAWGFVAGAWFVVRLAAIDLAAPYWAMAFAFEGTILLALAPALEQAPTPQAQRRRMVAALFILAVTVVGPLLLPLLGNFALDPDPTALATLGLIAAIGRWRWALTLPLAWCVYSGALYWTLGLVVRP